MTDNIQLPSALHRIGVEYGPWAMNTASVEDLLDRGQKAFDRISAMIASPAQPSLLDAYRAAREKGGKRLGQRGAVGIL